MDFEVYWKDHYVGRFENGVCVEHVYHNPKLDVIMKYPADKFLSRRVFPEVRWNDEMREAYGFDEYSPLEICKVTHGYMMADFLWLKFPNNYDEDLTWEEVNVFGRG